MIKLLLTKPSTSIKLFLLSTDLLVLTKSYYYLEINIFSLTTPLFLFVLHISIIINLFERQLLKLKSRIKILNISLISLFCM